MVILWEARPRADYRVGWGDVVDMKGWVIGAGAPLPQWTAGMGEVGGDFVGVITPCLLHPGRLATNIPIQYSYVRFLWKR